MQVSKVVDAERFAFKKIEYIRFPLRLGHDVFAHGEITPRTEEKFVKLMLAFKQFLELYEVDDYMVCATSAMREAHNGLHIAKRVYYNVGLRINIIDGEEEGNIINKAIFPYLDNGSYLHIDVGGGSTELGIIVNQEKVAVRSFRMGSVRQLPAAQQEAAFGRMRDWLRAHLPAEEAQGIRMVATGGNIKKLAELAGSNRYAFGMDEVQRISDHVALFDYDDRMKRFNMNPDRADVIVPAANIYLQVARMAGASAFVVPDVGLKDGIIISLCQKHLQDPAVSA
jgi:exopolyphosphatase/guanosine-5'-triphosphate,3'-diphosphate pyrophosphatase